MCHIAEAHYNQGQIGQLKKGLYCSSKISEAVDYKNHYTDRCFDSFNMKQMISDWCSLV